MPHIYTVRLKPRTLYLYLYSTTKPLSFQLLAEVNGPAKADDSKTIMGNSCDAFHCTNRFGSGVVFDKIPCYKERQKVWLITLKLAKPHNLKYACVCCDHFLVGNLSITHWFDSLYNMCYYIHNKYIKGQLHH